jgi:hypothetical protein
MTNIESVSRENAKRVLRAIELRYEGLMDDCGHPILIDNYMETGHFGIVWEGGPDEWALRAAAGGVSGEIAGTLYYEFGMPLRGALRRAMELPLQIPHSVRLEPYYSFSVVIYPSD